MGAFSSRLYALLEFSLLNFSMQIQDPQYTGRTNTSTASCDHATELIGLVSLLQGEVVLRRLRLRLVLKDDGS
jgi:hypothetical protein